MTEASPEAHGVAALMLLALVVYALLGGADFGGGIWDLFASGPRRDAQRRLIAQAIAPVWEANHVWLIFVVVLLFSGFPEAFSVVCTSLHVPLTLMLFGIVARGSAFVFRQYGSPEIASQQRWGRVFAVASTVTPGFLGVCLGAITADGIRVEHHVPTTGFVRPWLAPFPFAVGLLVVCLFAFLAAAYLTNETTDPELAGDFRKRGLASGIALGGAAALCAALAGPGTVHFREAFFSAWWTWPFQIATGLVALSALWALWARRYPLARVLAAAQVVLMIAGWALGHRPYLVTPDVTLASAAAPPITLRILLVVSLIGIALLAPAIYWMLRVLRRAPG